MRICRFTPLVALLLAAPGRGDGGAELLCSFTDARGTIRVFAKEGGLRVVAARDDRPYSAEPDMKGLSGRVVSAKVIPFAQGFAIALVARGDRASSCHYLVATKPDAPAQLSPPLFSEVGEPYRIAELLNPSGDALQILFARGLLDATPAGAVPQIRVFSDNCASAPSGLVAGKSRLVDLGVAK